MSYVTLEAATMTILQGVTGYLDSASIPAGNSATSLVTLGDYGALDIGSDHCAVLRPGILVDASTSARQTSREYHILVDIFRRWYDDTTTLELFAVFRDAVLAKLDQYPTLNLQGTVVVLGIGADTDPVDVNDANGNGPFFVTQRLRVRVREKIMQTGGEYA